ncbi:hypothetical protein [Aestuariirhabdus litorea]|uniref:Uncharacterized protein n=1 Tax=Aestuariirhabdus litorea TaxID=2528527 RepID=A0A3P3VSD8_9GAMM|nr:hypothetical protein [Aestuariirhabdus litorea]RRJ84606.1 hypothetical protein D0544_05740 [Aestuariirhabdus litorea]RWW97832.1 hypothetical protein DZC74_05735 [Endozoicomonadaceae bacterium GTF-13]
MQPRIFFYSFLLSMLLAPQAGARLINNQQDYEWDGTHFRVPLELWDRGSTPHHNTPVSSGVPLPYGLVNEPGELRLEDDEGNEVPCQISVLSRYWARDNSIRWVLLDFQTSLDADQKRRFWLTNRPSTPAPPFLQLQRSDDRWTLGNGRLSLEIDLKSNRLLSALAIDGIPLLAAKSGDGLVMESYPAPYAEHMQGSAWNTHGWNKERKRVAVNIPAQRFVSQYQTDQVTLEINGSQRAVVLIRGRFQPADGSTFQPPFYHTQTRIHLYRDSNRLRIEHSIGNSGPSQPFWVLPYHMSGWHISLALPPTKLYYGLSGTDQDQIHSSSNSSSEPFWLGQGAPENIKKGGRYLTRPGPLLASDPSSKKEDAIARYLAVSGKQASLMLTLADLWQLAPQRLGVQEKRIEVEFNARPEDFPPNTSPKHKKPWYQLDIGERTYHDLTLAAFPYPARPQELASIAQSAQYPLRAMAPVRWYQDTEVWYQEIAASGYPPVRSSKRHWVAERGGYRRYGEERSYNSGGHHSSLNSSWLAPLQERSGESLEREEARSRWSITHNPGLNYRLGPLSWNSEAPYRGIKQQLDQWNQTAGFGGKEIYLWASSQDGEEKSEGQSYLNFYKWLPDIEHYALFRMFEWYYLTGSPWALETINGFVSWGLNFQSLRMFQGNPPPLEDTQLFERDRNALRRAHYSRIYNWMLYTNLAGLHATGNPVMDYFARWQIRRALTLLRLRHGQFSNWKDEVLGSLDSPENLVIDRDHPELFSPLSNKLYGSNAKTWMEAQAPLALHEAYKTYRDERILDALWGQADYFANHALFYPQLGLFNEVTAMPHTRYGASSPPIKPIWHDRYLQAFPLLYYYSGDPRLRTRYEQVKESAKNRWIRPWFTQVVNWEQSAGIAKRSTQAPDAILDLTVVKASRAGGIQLQWSSPTDDGPSGHADRYFVKLSNRPIVEYAASNHPQRLPALNKALADVEQLISNQSKGKKKLNLRVDKDAIERELDKFPLEDPNWQRVDAFWMAEHVAGEPLPSAAGTPERFTLRELLPYAWFGLDKGLPIDQLPSGTYYLAIKSWDSDQNLSAISNVVKIDLN